MAARSTLSACTNCRPFPRSHGPTCPASSRPITCCGSTRSWRHGRLPGRPSATHPTPSVGSSTTAPAPGAPGAIMSTNIRIGAEPSVPLGTEMAPAGPAPRGHPSGQRKPGGLDRRLSTICCLLLQWLPVQHSFLRQTIELACTTQTSDSKTPFGAHRQDCVPLGNQTQLRWCYSFTGWRKLVGCLLYICGACVMPYVVRQ